MRATEFLRGLRAGGIGAGARFAFAGIRRRGFGCASARASRWSVFAGQGNLRLAQCSLKNCEVPFIELDRLIEQEAGVSLGVIFDLYGQSGFRRLERRCLDEVIERYPKFVLATGGSLVSEPGTFDRLLTACFTVWLRATPEDHMQRVIAQGDRRPMADNREAMTDLSESLPDAKSFTVRPMFSGD